MLFTSQGRSVLGKTVPSVLCTAQDPLNNIYKLLVQHDTNKRLSAVKEKLLKW